MATSTQPKSPKRRKPGRRTTQLAGTKAITPRGLPAAFRPKRRSRTGTQPK